MATKPARPALDAWLAKTEQVLAEARDDALSPSIAPGPWDERRTQQGTTLAGLAAQLEELLSRLVFGPGRWVLIVEDPGRRYVQVLAFEDSSLVTEVISNKYLGDEQRWSVDDDKKLLALGWCLPAERWPNWRKSYPTISPDVAEVSALLLATLRTVFGLDEAGPLRLTMLSCRLREGTPASQGGRPVRSEGTLDYEPVRAGRLSEARRRPPSTNWSHSGARSSTGSGTRRTGMTRPGWPRCEPWSTR